MGAADLSQYCREVEEHLTRVNGGHLVRIVGAGFELVRQWAAAGVPLTIVFRGIERKADRHRLGHARRPLRLEFCEHDVLETYESWRRAVGLPRAGPAEMSGDAPDEPRRPASLVKQIDRAADRLRRVVGRLDLAEPFLAAVGEALEELAGIREQAAKARGQVREELAGRLVTLDGRLLAAARDAVGRETLDALTAAAAADLSAFRDRLTGDAWRQAVGVTTDRLLRDRYGLPALDAAR